MAITVAFLRAINVGGHTIKMDHLKDLFSQLGFTQITTFIASGNVIFATDRTDYKGLELQIENYLKAALGYDVATFLRSPVELQAISTYQPFSKIDVSGEGFRVHAGFLKSEPPEGAQRRLQSLRTAVDDFHVHKREVYWLCRIRTSESTFSGAVLEKTMGMSATLRNMTTVRKIAALVSAI